MLETKELTNQPVLPVDAPLTADWRLKVPTVSELTRRLRGHIENSFFDVWVRGEISTLRKPGSGHSYFTLKDTNAQLSGVLFRGAASKLKFQVEEGMEVLAHGSVTVYEARGQYQLVCDTIEPCGVGALQLAFEQLKSRLNQEGLFDAKKKRVLPFLPKHIGIVTSATGAAVRDVLKVISRRFPDRQITIFPCAVQGEKAASEIVTALNLAEKWNSLCAQGGSGRLPVEVLIVGRGGGSLEDLWPFNEEIVARKLATCSIPTISAVGHEIDFTIADFVSDLRAPTPSAAAEIVFPKLEDLIYQVETRRERLELLMKKRLQQLRLHLGHLSQRLLDPRERIRQLKDQFRKEIDHLTQAMRTRLQFARRRLENGAGLLQSLSPLQILGRGYSVTRTPEGTIVRSVRAVKPGDTIQTQLPDGTLSSQVL
ncbi:MAG: exodeoxyribonuclease VII large subunit [Deltaproteobacteria bacterium]|nr:exodeoxyribonuclease VII large subunit [Deltaproteobacteria bacterium]MBI3295657.1 exodeoxyribonuclease VII large subunit [Deltaproteobacteria bacterium]